MGRCRRQWGSHCSEALPALLEAHTQRATSRCAAQSEQWLPLSPQGELDTRHHKKRDSFTVYSEAHLRNIHMGWQGDEAQKAQ